MKRSPWPIFALLNRKQIHSLTLCQWTVIFFFLSILLSYFIRHTVVGLLSFPIKAGARGKSTTGLHDYMFETKGFTCEWEGGHIPLRAGEVTLRQPGTCRCGAIGDNMAPEPSRDDSQHGQDAHAFKHPDLKNKQVKSSVLFGRPLRKLALLKYCHKLQLSSHGAVFQ